jgi:adenosylhomocysteine nucleosidase
VINKTDVVILISAGAEWRALLPYYPQARLKSTPYGEYFTTTIANQNTTFLHGGWGKVAAAGSTQYAIDRWHPASLINIGTCGGFFGQIEGGEIVCAEKTIIYDIVEQMSDSEGAIDHYAVDLDLSWLPTPPPQPVVRTTLVSADRDILPVDIPTLIEKYQAQAADWESGAIAWVAQRNHLPCLILRAVSDLVDGQSGEAYGNYALFEKQCEVIMTNFALNLPNWIRAFTKPKH